MVNEKDVQNISPVRRRDILAVTGAGVTAALAGCGVSEPRSDNNTFDKDSITVGALSQTGVPPGKSILNGAELAAKHINADGGIEGATIDLVSPDSTGENYHAADVHDQMCADDGCEVTIGLTIPSAVKATLPSIAKHEIVHLTTGSVDGEVSRTVAENYDDYKYHFRMGLPDMEALATALSTFVEEQAAANQWEAAAVVTSNSSVFKPFREHLIDSLSAYMDVPIDETTAGGGGYESLFEDVEQAGCDVMLCGYMTNGSHLAKSWAGRESSFALGGFSWGAMRPQQWVETDGDVESMFGLNALTPYSENTDRTRKFVTTYQQTFGQVPMYSGALTYDALHFYREVVEDLIERDGEFPEQEAIVQALEKRSFTGGVVYPEFDFTGPDSNQVHEPVWNSMAEDTVPIIQQWQEKDNGKGSMEALVPEQVQTATYEAPPWLS